MLDVGRLPGELKEHVPVVGGPQHVCREVVGGDKRRLRFPLVDRVDELTLPNGRERGREPRSRRAKGPASDERMTA